MVPNDLNFFLLFYSLNAGKLNSCVAGVDWSSVTSFCLVFHGFIKTKFRDLSLLCSVNFELEIFYLCPYSFCVLLNVK
jgi:hypothetical protein